jgi:hypothetical protein
MSEPEEPGSPVNNRPGNGAGRTAAGRFAKGNKLGGRPKGSRNQRSIEMDQLLAARGDLHPADFLSQVMNGALPGFEPSHRIAAATALLPYRAARPQPSRFVSKSIDLPPPASASEAAEQIVKLNSLAASGEVSLDEAALLIDNLRDFAVAFRTAALEPQIMELRAQVADTIWRRTQ